MRLGLIADVHADLDALRAALAVLAREGVAQVICAGDVAEKGMDGNAVVRLLQAHKIPCVMGNHDHDVIGNQLWWREHGSADHPAVRARLLADETLDYLRQLPQTLSTTWGGKRLLLAHGTPWSTGVYLPPNSPRELFERVAREARADVVILGHTHTAMCAQVGDVWIINPGSVSGGHARDSHTCAVLTLPDCAFQAFDISTGQHVPVPEVHIQPGSTPS